MWREKGEESSESPNHIPPSDTTTLGFAIRLIRASQAPECSYLHRYHPNTKSLSQHIKIHDLRDRYMPSKYSTSFDSSIFGVNANLQDLQNHLWVPDFILPCFIHLQLQMGQLTCFIIYSSKNTDSKEDIPRFSIEFPIF